MRFRNIFHTFHLTFSQLRIVGILFFTVQLVLAVIYYIERASYMDVAFQTFEMITHLALQPQVYRFGSAMTQIFPFIGILFKAPLWVVALLYSVGVVIYNFILFYYIAFVKKSKHFTLIYIVYAAMLLAYMFFWIQSEYSQALPLLIVLLSFLEDKKWSHFSIFNWLMLLVLICTLVFFHPLAFIALSISLYLLFVISTTFFDKKILIATWFLGIITYAVKHLYFNNWYDAGAHERIDNFKKLFPHYFDTETTIQFFTQNLFYNAGLIISFVMLIYLLFSTKKWLLSCLLLLPIVAYFFFINITHPSGDAFYMENMYLALPLFIAIIFVFLFPKKEQIVIRLTMFLCILFVARVVVVSKVHTQRLAYFNTLIEKYQHQKVIIAESKVPMNLLEFSWPSAYEIWMLSTIKAGHTASIVIVDDVQKLFPFKDTSNAFIGIQIYSYKDLPARYFHFEDSLSLYKIVE